MPKLEFGHIPLQMLRFALVVSADHATLEDTKEVFGGIGGLAFTADIVCATSATSVLPMLYCLVHGKFAAHVRVEVALVCVQFGCEVGVFKKSFAH